MPFAGYKDFGACVKAQRNKGKSPESARKICGALQARVEGRAANASQVPAEFKPHFNRTAKTLDFLRQQGVLAEDDNDNEQQGFDYTMLDTSLDNQIPKPVQLSNIIYNDPESYNDKVTRIMDEYGIPEDDAKKIVGEIIENEMKELDRREYEVMKQLQIEKAQADLMTSDDNNNSSSSSSSSNNNSTTQETEQEDVSRDNSDNQSTG